MPFCPRAPHMGRPRLAALLLLLALATVAPSSFVSASSLPGAAALAAQAPVWVLLDGSEPAAQLFAPGSGALLARTASGLKRSDDGGATWRTVELPPRASFQRRIVVEIDPTDHTHLFANGEQGLYRSTDDAATWTLLSLPTRIGASIRDIAVSPADPSLVYLTTAPQESIGSTMWLHRSRDGGETWEMLQEKHAGPSCGVGVYIFWPHPTDASRVYRQAGCFRDEPVNARLEHSADQGATWSYVTEPAFGAAMRMAGGHGAEPARFYLGTAVGGGSSQVFWSASGLGEWTFAHRFEGETIGAIAYDPRRPEHPYLGTSSGNVYRHVDGVQHWERLSEQALGRVYDLALGVDGANLFAATEQGVWRYLLTAPEPSQ